MNKSLEVYARGEIARQLKLLPPAWQGVFKRMYGKAEQSVDEIVAVMPAEKLDWALTQINNSLKKLSRQAGEGV